MDSLNLVLGLYDNPEEQKQENYEIDLYRNNLAVFGSAMSGKSTILKTILIRLHQVIQRKGGEEVYILDFGNALKRYKDLPYVKAYFEASNEENIRRVFGIMEEKLIMHMQKLNGTTYVESQNKSNVNHVTFILDGLHVFMSEPGYDSYQEMLLKITREGLSQGITVIFTANDSSNGITRLLSSVKRMIALDLPQEKYDTLFPIKTSKPITLEGRGLVNIEIKVYEFQAYLPYNVNIYPEIEGEERFVAGFIEKLKGIKDEYGVDIEALQKQQLVTFEKELLSSEWKSLLQEVPPNLEQEATVGIDYYSFKPISLSLEHLGVIAIYGKKSSGKTNLLKVLLRQIQTLKPEARFVFVDDAREGLSEITDNAMRSLEEFEAFLESNEYYYFPAGLYSSKRQEKQQNVKAHPYTVFVIQNQKLYRQPMNHIQNSFLEKLIPFVSDAVSRNALFIFSDVKPMKNKDMLSVFNSEIGHAFLLDDIVKYVSKSGSHSIFENLEIKELKEMFGPWNIGDGFYFDTEKDLLTKFKMIKDESSFEKMVSWENDFVDEESEENEGGKQSEDLVVIDADELYEEESETVAESDKDNESLHEESESDEEEDSLYEESESDEEEDSLYHEPKSDEDGKILYDEVESDQDDESEQVDEDQQMRDGIELNDNSEVNSSEEQEKSMQEVLLVDDEDIF